jgi:hypothetical protein
MRLANRRDFGSSRLSKPFASRGRASKGRPFLDHPGHFPISLITKNKKHANRHGRRRRRLARQNKSLLRTASAKSSNRGQGPRKNVYLAAKLDRVAGKLWSGQGWIPGPTITRKRPRRAYARECELAPLPYHLELCLPSGKIDWACVERAPETATKPARISVALTSPGV